MQSRKRKEHIRKYRRFDAMIAAKCYLNLDPYKKITKHEWKIIKLFVKGKLK